MPTPEQKEEPELKEETKAEE
jgi:translation initiation factor 1 (eIF-1/SUI1)